MRMRTFTTRRARPVQWTSAGLCLSLLITMPAAADVFHLTSGGSVDGELLARESDYYRVRTAAGTISLLLSQVVRIDPGETPFREYDQRAAEVENTAAAHMALAEWCAAQGLPVEYRRHLQQATELEPNYAPARRALGFVRAGDLWVKGGVRFTRTPETLASEQERLAQAIESQWYQRVRAIKAARLESTNPDLVNEGRAQILAIKDPLAIQPLTDVLSEGNVPHRALLVEALSQFTEDEATRNLTVLGLVESDTAVREAAIAELVRRNDIRSVARYRLALHTNNDVVVKRAAFALGELKVTDAIPELIALLTAERDRWVEVPVRWYLVYLGGYGDAHLFPPGSPWHVAEWTPSNYRRPTFQVPYWADYVFNEWQYRRVTVYRTEVLEALRTITGQDFGFEAEDWQRWYDAQKS